MKKWIAILLAALLTICLPLAEAEDCNSAVVTSSLLNDLPAHTVMIPGSDGTAVYINELHSSYTVENGYATAVIPDHFWYDSLEDLTDETMDVTLTPYLKGSSGERKPLDPVTYTISIPASPVSLESPDSARTTVATTISTIRIIVVPGSRVTVNGADCSDTVNSVTGEMSYNAIVQPIGENVFNISVRSRYCRESTLRVVLYREPQDIPLDLAAGTYSATNARTMKISAVTLPGASVEVTTPYTDLDVSRLDVTGQFSFSAVFDHIGDNTVTVIASCPGKKPSRIDHTVCYVPEVSEYTRKAWALDPANYGELLGNMAVRAEKNQVYVIKGVVQYSVSDKPQMVVVNSGEDGKSMPVLIENKSKTDLKAGQYYRIYADAYSTYNGMPWLVARYVYTN